jgi:hypothetical protein
MSYAPQVIADATGLWVGNALRFATHDEALAYVMDLQRRWLLVREVRVIQALDPVTHEWDREFGLVQVNQARAL